MGASVSKKRPKTLKNGPFGPVFSSYVSKNGPIYTIQLVVTTIWFHILRSEKSTGNILGRQITVGHAETFMAKARRIGNTFEDQQLVVKALIRILIFV